MFTGFGWKGLVIALFVSGIPCWGDETNSLKETNAQKVIKAVGVAPSASPRDSFQLKKGFRIEQAALDGMVASPVALAFDERGRLFVVEMRDYPDKREQLPHAGQVVLLEDSDGDGIFDSSHVYADNLAWPSAIACYDGGIFVAANPEVIYFKDTAGNGVADQRKVIFTGFGGDSGSPNPDALLNNFVWGLDNRIHGGTAGISGLITTVGAQGNPPIVLGQNDFSFDPKTLTLWADGGPARTGLCFDGRGRKYVSEFGHPLQLSMFEAHYFARNPFFPKPPQLTDVINPDTRVFGRTSAGSSSSNGFAPTWMSKARGCVIYQGNAFPSNYVGNAFVCDPDLHLIHRSILSEQGLGVVGQRARDELTSEFLVGKDPTFHPIQLVTGPEGALYVADIANGGQSGRLLRIVPENFKYQKPAPLIRTKTYDLVSALAHPNVWQRETASRLLYEQRDPGAVALLTNMVNNSRLAPVRMRALAALDGVGSVKEGALLKGLRDSDETVRQHAVALCERLVRNGRVSDALWSQLSTLGADASIRVLYQLAFTLGDIEIPQRNRLLAQLLGANLANPWFRSAILSSVNKGGSDLLIGLASEARWRNDLTAQAFLNELALSIGLKGQMNEVGQVLDFFNRSNLDPQTTFSLLYSIGEGLHRIGSSLALVDPQNRLQKYYDQSLQIILDDSLKDPPRLAALRLLSVSYYTASDPGDIYQLLFGTGQSEAVQATALGTLARYENPLLGTNIISHWQELPAGIKRQAVTALLGRSERVGQLLSAVEGRRISISDVFPAQINFLRFYREPEVSQRATRIFGPFTAARPAVVEQFKPALTIVGAAARGRDIFRGRCSSCHRLAGDGFAFGPDLVSAKSRGKQGFLSAILEPSREITASYVTTVLETRRHENLLGIITDDNGVTVTLREPNGAASVWPRGSIQTFEPQTWSLMPDGLEQGMNLQMMADLLEYLMVANF